MSEQEHNLFGELLSVLHTEDLYRLKVRAKKKGLDWLAQVLADEIAERELDPSAHHF